MECSIKSRLLAGLVTWAIPCALLGYWLTPAEWLVVAGMLPVTLAWALLFDPDPHKTFEDERYRRRCERMYQ